MRPLKTAFVLCSKSIKTVETYGYIRMIESVCCWLKKRNRFTTKTGPLIAKGHFASMHDRGGDQPKKFEYVRMWHMSVICHTSYIIYPQVYIYVTHPCTDSTVVRGTHMCIWHSVKAAKSMPKFEPAILFYVYLNAMHAILYVQLYLVLYR